MRGGTGDGDGGWNELEGYSRGRERMYVCVCMHTGNRTPPELVSIDANTATPSTTSIHLPTLLFPHHATLHTHLALFYTYTVCTSIHPSIHPPRTYIPTPNHLTQSPLLPSSPIYFNRPRAGTIPLRPLPHHVSLGRAPNAPSRDPLAPTPHPITRPGHYFCKLQAAMLAPTARLVRCSLCTARMYIWGMRWTG